MSVQAYLPRPIAWIDGHPLYPADACRFWLKVNVREDHECWPWQAGMFRYQYGQFALGTRETAKKISAHRFALVLAGFTVTSGQVVLHECDNSTCVNPAHLRLGTQADNIADMVAKGRQARGSMKPKAKLTENQVAEIRKRTVGGEARGLLATEYGVSRSLIGYIVTRQIWKHVT